MEERFRKQFVELLKKGAAVQDIHDSPVASGYAVTSSADDQFIQRELNRVDHHRRNACWLLEKYLGRAERILDAGSGTGGFSVALALSEVLRPAQVIGVDASRLALQAANLRAAGYALSSPLLSFLHCSPGQPLPFDDDYFDLTVCSSVIEFVTSKSDRMLLITELGRVTRPGGHVFISTPNPRLHEYHSGRFLGDYFHRPGFPWASSPRELSRIFSGWHEIPVTKYYRKKIASRLGADLPIPEFVLKVVSRLAPWQNRLFRKDVSPAIRSSRQSVYSSIA